MYIPWLSIEEIGVIRELVHQPLSLLLAGRTKGAHRIYWHDPAYPAVMTNADAPKLGG